MGWVNVSILPAPTKRALLVHLSGCITELNTIAHEEAENEAENEADSSKASAEES